MSSYKYWFEFYLCPIFSESNMSIFLDPFGEIFIWVIFKNDSEASKIPSVQISEFKHDAHMTS